MRTMLEYQIYIPIKGIAADLVLSMKYKTDQKRIDSLLPSKHLLIQSQEHQSLNHFPLLETEK